MEVSVYLRVYRLVVDVLTPRSKVKQVLSYVGTDHFYNPSTAQPSAFSTVPGWAANSLSITIAGMPGLCAVFLIPGIIDSCSIAVPGVTSKDKQVKKITFQGFRHSIQQATSLFAAVASLLALKGDIKEGLYTASTRIRSENPGKPHVLF